MRIDARGSVRAMRTSVLVLILLATVACGGEPSPSGSADDTAEDTAEDASEATSASVTTLIEDTIIPNLEASTAFRSTAAGNLARMAIARHGLDRAVELLSRNDWARASSVLSSVVVPVLESSAGYRAIVAGNKNRFFETKLGLARRGIDDALAALGQTNLALRQRAFSSTRWSSAYDASLAIDGDIASGWAAAAGDPSPWLELDLGAPVVLRRIRIVTRQDLDQPMTRQNFQIWTSDQEDMSRGHSVLATVGATPLPFKGSFLVEVADPAPHRFVAIAKTDGAHFFLSEARVFGTRALVTGGDVSAARAALRNTARTGVVGHAVNDALDLLALAPAESGSAHALLSTIAPLATGAQRTAIDRAIAALEVIARPTIWQSAGTMLWHADAFAPSVKAPLLRNNGFKWVSLQVHDGVNTDPLTIAQLDAGWVTQLKNAGLSVGAWGVNRLDPEGEAAVAASLIRRYGFDFYIADAEIEYKYTQGDGSWSPEAYGRSQRFVRAFRSELPSLPAAISSYGRTDLADIDWAAWRDSGFDWLPQAYWNDYDIYQPSACIEAAVASGWPRARVHPTIGIWGGGIRAYVTGDEYVADMTGHGITGFSVYLGENVPDQEWAALGRGVASGLAR